MTAESAAVIHLEVWVTPTQLNFVASLIYGNKEV